MGDRSKTATDVPPVSAIEEAFPVGRLQQLAALEAYNKHHYRPTNYQHKWWARRLGSVFRMITIAALSEPGRDADALWEQFSVPTDVGEPVVFDPFMGGGTTGQEVTRVGGRFVGCDLNPVAWFIAKMALAPQPSELDTAFDRVRSRTSEEIRPYYRTRCPKCGDPAGVQFFLWVRLIEEEDGGSDEFSRQYDTLVVDHRRDGGATVVCPSCHSLSAVDDPEAASCGSCAQQFDATGTDVRVPVRDPTPVFTGPGRPAYEPYALKYDCDQCGERGFSAFSAFDAATFRDAARRLETVREELPIPSQAIPTGGAKTRDLHSRNYSRWTHLFNARQLLSLGTLLRHIEGIEDTRARQYLTLAFSAALEFNTMFCSYKGADPRGPGAVRHVFSHHAFVHPKEPLENNPLGTRDRQSGTFRYLFDYRLKRALEYQSHPVERILDEDGTVAEKKSLRGEQIGGNPAPSVEDLLAGEGTHYLHCGNSGTLPFGDTLAGAADAVITDPPYFDSVQYSELADFFYVWLKQALERDFPEAFAADSVVSPAEAVGNRTRQKSLDDYRDLLTAAFEEAHCVLHPEGVLVFTFHHKESKVWGAVLEALAESGFRVVKTYPVRGENRLSVHIQNQRAVLLDSIVVCRKGHRQPARQWRALAETIATLANERVDAYHSDMSGDLSRLDASVVVRGVCLEVYSTYETVRDGGDIVGPREAMARLESVIEEINETAFSE